MAFMCADPVRSGALVSKRESNDSCREYFDVLEAGLLLRPYAMMEIIMWRVSEVLAGEHWTLLSVLVR